VGDIAGMGADLFGSFAEASVSALVLSSVSSLGNDRLWTAMCYPLILSATSILVCIVTTILASDLSPARSIRQIQPVLKSQLIISSLLMALAMLPVTLGALPKTFTGIYIFDATRSCANWQVYIAVLSGIITGLLIGLITEYYTSTAYKPVRDVAEACRTGAATNIIYGLALGYKSVVIPVFGIAFTIFLAYEMASFYGIACAALGALLRPLIPLLSQSIDV
jgi:inorganic pyrophosphatase